MMTPGIWAVLIFTLAYMALSVPLVLLRGNTEFLLYIIVLVVILGAIWSIHSRVRLTLLSLWGLSLWGAAHLAGGLVVMPEGWIVNAPSRVLYSWWIVPGYLKYDNIIHACGFAITTWVCWQGLQAIIGRGNPVRPTVGMMTLSAAAGMGFGALNEVVEFAVTIVVPETNVGGYVNTGWDMVANFVGATVAASLIWFLGRRTPTRA